MGKPFLIGICGGSGSGKTYFLNRVLDHFSDKDVCLISQDNYYKSIDQVPIDKNGIENFDDPAAIDFDLFESHVEALTRGEEVQQLEYTFNNKDKAPDLITYQPAPIIIVEGIFIFFHEKMREFFDLKLFVSAPDYVKIKRRIIRDNKERGYDLDDVLYRYEYHVAPAFEKHIRPYIDECDIMVHNKKTCDIAVEVVSGYLKTRLLSEPSYRNS